MTGHERTEHDVQPSFPTRGVLALAITIGCNGKLAVLTAPVEGEADAGRGSASGSSTFSGGSSTPSGGPGASPGVLPTASDPLRQCPELSLDLEYTSSFDTPAPPVQCGACDCAAGELACEQQECVSARTLPRCEEEAYDQESNAAVRDYQIAGYTLYIELEGYGGCGQDDFHLCYIPPYASTAGSQQGYPKTATIKYFNTTPPEKCDRIAFQHLEYDLRTLGEFKSDEGNLVNSTFGQLGLAPLSCPDRVFLASGQFQYFQKWDRQCTTDADCEAVFVGPDCSNTCSSSVGSQAGIAQLRTAAANINANVCAGFSAQCAMSADAGIDVSSLFPAACPAELPVPECKHGKCQ
jgi:hypothetical protein